MAKPIGSGMNRDGLKPPEVVAMEAAHDEDMDRYYERYPDVLALFFDNKVDGIEVTEEELRSATLDSNVLEKLSIDLTWGRISDPDSWFELQQKRIDAIRAHRNHPS